MIYIQVNQKESIHVIPSNTRLYEVKVEHKWLRVLKMKNFKTSPKLHFGVANKDLGLVFHFDDLNLLKS
jgi:hypothetical protein